MKNSGVETTIARTTSIVHARHAVGEAVLDAVPYQNRIAFICHPVTWMESWWKFANTAGNTEQEARSNHYECWRVYHPMQAIRPWDRLSFAEFAEKAVENCPGFVSWMMRTYIGSRRRKLVWYVGRRENLLRDFAQILTRSNITFDRDRLLKTVPQNVSAKRSTVWPARVLARFVEAEQDIIDEYYRGTIPTTTLVSP